LSAVFTGRLLPLFLVPALTISLLSIPALGSTPRKRSKSDRNIDAIGHRKIAWDGNWYSLAKEKELGEKFSAGIERSIPVLQDPAVGAYIDSLLQHIAQNSDAQMQVTVRIVNSNDVWASTTFDGHQYITSGLILQLRNEGELAGVLARGVAHTALRSATVELTRSNLLQMASAIAWPGQNGSGSSAAATPDAIGLGAPLVLLRFSRMFELDADYFGIQYLYKSGYDTQYFLSAIQRIWPATPGNPALAAFSPFPPTSDRLTALKKEIAELLPKRDGALESSPEFDQFQEHLRSLKPPEPDPMPKLIRRDPPSLNAPPSI
jgi:predicted Zn-dependent protease